MSAALQRALVDAASVPYRPAGRFAWHFARSKLRHDPVFAALLERGIIPDAQRLLDLGCGQGLLASWLRSARSLHDAGQWQPGWPTPPNVERIEGVELMPNDVARARAALGDRCTFTQGDLRIADFGTANVVVMLDVLHFIAHDEQPQVLRRVRDALQPDGLLVMRVGDARAGLPFHLSRWVDATVAFFRGHRRPRNHCRPAAEWTRMLVELGFRVEALPMSSRTPFANVLLVARLDKTGSAQHG